MLTTPLQHHDTASLFDLNLFVPTSVLLPWAADALRRVSGSAMAPGNPLAASRVLRAVADEPLLKAVKRLDRSLGEPPPPLFRVHLVANGAPCSVVIRIGGSWASGVVVSADGLILTNAHLLRPFYDQQQLTDHSACFEQPRQRIFVRLSSEHYEDPASAEAARDAREEVAADWGRWHSASAVFMATRGPWDIALLQVAPGRRLCPAPADRWGPYRTGEPAFVIGHALFGPPAGLRASVTNGLLALVEEVDGWPVLLQSSAAVHSGNSGGALVSADGRWIGLVTCNTRTAEGVVRGFLLPSCAMGSCCTARHAQIIPRLNFSIPLSALAPLFDFCAELPAARDRRRLGALNVAKPEVGKQTRASPWCTRS